MKSFDICKKCMYVLICKDGFVCTINCDKKSLDAINIYKFDDHVVMPEKCQLKLEMIILNNENT